MEVDFGVVCSLALGSAVTVVVVVLVVVVSLIECRQQQLDKDASVQEEELSKCASGSMAREGNRFAGNGITTIDSMDLTADRVVL